MDDRLDLQVGLARYSCGKSVLANKCLADGAVMQKFRHSRLVEAEQFKGLAIEGVCYKNDLNDGKPVTLDDYGNAPAHVHPTSGVTQRLTLDDWVISEGDGVHYAACPANIFELEYSPSW